MYQSIFVLFKRIRNCFYDVHKWLDDVAVQQVALMIWEMSKKTNIAIQMLFYITFDIF